MSPRFSCTWLTWPVEAGGWCRADLSTGRVAPSSCIEKPYMYDNLLARFVLVEEATEMLPSQWLSFATEFCLRRVEEVCSGKVEEAAVGLRPCVRLAADRSGMVDSAAIAALRRDSRSTCFLTVFFGRSVAKCPPGADAVSAKPPLGADIVSPTSSRSPSDCSRPSVILCKVCVSFLCLEE